MLIFFPKKIISFSKLPINFVKYSTTFINTLSLLMTQIDCYQ